jgi:hypothetical protein
MPNKLKDVSAGSPILENRSLDHPRIGPAF